MKVRIVMFGMQHLEEGVQVFLPRRIVLPGARCSAKCQNKRDGADGYESGHRNTFLNPGSSKPGPSSKFVIDH
jgi:hypothetical protein